jgi:predicted pyridoxine 5'-phosphate oxidase superfamily flavin-nucleotide-binding protein
MRKSKRKTELTKAIFALKKDAVLATVNNEGIPNIVPVHSKYLISKNKLLISDQFMKKTKTNVIENPFATLTIIDNGKVYHISGKCQYKTKGFFYAMAVKGVKKYDKKRTVNHHIKINCNGIVLMRITEFKVMEAK